MKNALLLASWLMVMAGMVTAAGQTIEGYVRDQQGAAVPGARVILTDTQLDVVRERFATDEGRFVFPDLPTGRYDLTAELSGFQPVRVMSITLRVGETLRYTLTLPVGAIASEIEILAAVEQVQTSTSDLGAIIDERRITDLPLNGRDPLDLVFLTPGVTVGIPVWWGNYPAINGSRARDNNYQLDGVDNNRTFIFGEVTQNNPEATAEFRVITATPPAQYGRAAGGIIEVITRSGTNHWHGNVFWFHRNDNLDAARWEENANPAIGKGEFKRNQLGASLGGPLRRETIFFFFNTQVQRVRTSPVKELLTPTEAFRESVVNDDIGDIFNLHYPEPNVPGEVFENTTGRYIWSAPRYDDGEQLTLKVDVLPTDNHSFFFRYLMNNLAYSWESCFPRSNMGAAVDDGFLYNLALDWTWYLSPTLLNTAKVGFNRFNLTEKYLNQAGYVLDFDKFFTPFGGRACKDVEQHTGTFEFKDTLTWVAGSHVFKFGINFRWIHTNTNNGYYAYPTFHFYSDSDIRTGRVGNVFHVVYSNGREFSLDTIDWRGWRAREYDFFIQDDWQIRSRLTLNLGLRYEYKPAPYEVNNLAASIDMDEAIREGYRLVNNANYFDPANWDNGDWQTGNPVWTGTGVDMFPVGPGTGADLYHAPKTGFAPRLGFAWDMLGDGRTAVRGGYGISFGRTFENLWTWGALAQPFGSLGFQNPAPGGVFDGLFLNGVAYYGHGYDLPSIQWRLPPSGSSFNNWQLTDFSMGGIVYNRNWKQPYSQTWNFSIQRELWPGHILTAAYVGSAGVHLLTRGNPLQMPEPLRSPEFLEIYSTIFGTATIFPQISWTAGRSQQWFRVDYIDPRGHSTYHALQLAFSRRLQAGLQCMVNYTWSKALDDLSDVVGDTSVSMPTTYNWYRPDWDRGFADFDVRHVFNASFIWELPLGPGHALGGNSAGFLAGLLGGWQVNGIVQANSGYPLDYVLNKSTHDTIGGMHVVRAYSNGPRPDVASTSIRRGGAHSNLPGYYLTGPAITNFKWAGITIFNPTGSYYRGSFRGPGYWNVDLSLFKEFKTPWFGGESAIVQLRLEAFNLFNHPNFNPPSQDLYRSGILGYSSSTASERQLQLGAKFIF
ncbi:MAG: TonB-dependent receptor [Acidobacteria bacterium]|nr:TonB-dependent receptor [Acidobacteriota bacterium]